MALLHSYTRLRTAEMACVRQRGLERERPSRAAGRTPGPNSLPEEVPVFGQLIGGFKVYFTPSRSRELEGY